MKTLIKADHLFDPSLKIDSKGEILIENGVITEIKLGESFQNPNYDEVIEFKNSSLTPGFIDIHVHFREPGEEYKETILTGSRAAVAGGFTSVCCMANTRPVNDNPIVTEFIKNKAREANLCRVHPISSASKNLEGEKLAELYSQIEAGCVAVSDDGKCVMNAQMARRVMEHLSDIKIPFIEHCEDCNLSHQGSMHEGKVSLKLGQKGIPHAAEDVIVQRDIQLARLTGAHVHLAHLSSRFSVQALAEAKKENLLVTGEVTPHHLLLTDSHVENMSAQYKMAPPLREEEDRLSLIDALEKGVIDCIATDHAPHSASEKSKAFSECPNGVIGLETAFSCCMKLVHENKLSFHRLIESLTIGPARVMGWKDRAQLKKGLLADFTVIDRQAESIIQSDRFFSKSKNTPFQGWKVKGRVTHSIVGGRLVYSLGKVL